MNSSSNENCGITDIFGSSVFNDKVMKERLPKNIYKAFRRVLDGQGTLEPSVADVIANAMKDWAIEKGATHYCHWFQPMTGITAEKHDSFISPTPDGSVIMEFSGKELIKGEPDASSFPSGGLRATFEARGYTAWDCTSPVFIKKDGENTTLFIPCAFCSYTSEALDKKTPLLRSMEAVSKQSIRVLRLMGNTTSIRVTPTLGAEQEYFLVDRQFVEDRLDLLLAGRSLFGAPSPKGQEMEDQYFGTLHDRIGSFMHDLNMTLWKLGISAKTQHNEVAPAQYELAPIFATVNIATDWNQVTMETLQNVALKHNFVCLLHEKPFRGVNGSGKHNNWSLATDDGINLLEPGSTPHSNAVFLMFLCAIIRGVDKYSKLLRASVASAGNDHRLGANEAPPAIISVFLGDQLADIFSQLNDGGAKTSKAGGEIKLASMLPSLPKDTTDRNRTSPFAFTGNKFEFRMPGSSQSTSGPNFVLNTIMAEILCEFADELEGAKDIQSAAQKILKRVAKDHARIIFNGDNYTEEWAKEAEKRGLPNIKNTVDSLVTILEKENLAIFKKHKVLSEKEMTARVEILLDNYVKTIGIEAKTTLHIAKRQIVPAVIQYAGSLASSVTAIKAAGAATAAGAENLSSVTELLDALQAAIAQLEKVFAEAGTISDMHKHAVAIRDKVIPTMNKVRDAADALEAIVDSEFWPLPTYADMLFKR
jgi:glutamine synthetase